MLGITSRLVCFISVLKEVISRIRSFTKITLSVVVSGEGCEQPAVVSFLSLSTDNSDWACPLSTSLQPNEYSQADFTLTKPSFSHQYISKGESQGVEPQKE